MLTVRLKLSEAMVPGAGVEVGVGVGEVEIGVAAGVLVVVGIGVLVGVGAAVGAGVLVGAGVWWAMRLLKSVPYASVPVEHGVPPNA